MAILHVEEDLGKEAVENPFPSGGMINVDGEMASASPNSTNREGRKIEEKTKNRKKTLKN